MTAPPAANRLDGVWWPRTRDLAGEIADLVDHFPAERYGRIVRVLVSPGGWSAHPRHVLVRDGYVKVGYLPDGDTSHLVHVTTSDRKLLPVLVVPPGFTGAQGDAALAAVATYRNRRCASALIQGVTDRGALDVRDALSARRVGWWASDPVGVSS